MGGAYPSGLECNLMGGGGQDHKTGAAASGFVFSNIPDSVPILWSGFEVGVRVQSGARLSSCAPESNPCRQAFIDYEHGPNKSRFSWDPLTTLAAALGNAPPGCSMCTQCDGKNFVDPKTGGNHWVPGP